MPLQKSDISNLLLPGIRASFFEALSQFTDDSVINQIATIVPSNKDTESYAWLGNVPGLREFIDERQVKSLIESSYSIKNKTWEDTLGVARTAIEDDQYGQIKLRIQELAYAAALHKQELVLGLLPLGATTTCYDGQYFFDTDHVTTGAAYSTNQSNKGTSALTAATLQTGIIAMNKFMDDQGKRMNIIPDTLIVPPDLQFTAREILESTYYPTGTSTTDYQKLSNNVLKGILTLIVSPLLTDTDNWYLLCTKRPLKPLILQERTPIEMTALEANSTNGFMRDEYLYGIRARYNAGYGPWQMAYGGIV